MIICFRRNAYSLLLSFSSCEPDYLRHIFSALTAFHSTIPVPDCWGFRPDRDLRAATGYVGLRNLGSTCYMNRYSTILCHTYYMKPTLILLIHSLLQVLFMIPEIRHGIIRTPVLPDQTDDVQKDNLLLQLKIMFLNLLLGAQKAFFPSNWAFAFKDESGAAPVTVLLQQDVNEFLQVLCERLELSLAQGNDVTGADGASKAYHTLLQNTLGGKICNQMLKEGGGSGADSVREREEQYVCISLDVKGYGTLEKSLAHFVAGEQISNFQWEDGCPRVSITKRQCLSQVADTVIFHLKRFELNFDTFRREKVNDEFTFPSLVNLLPFTKEGLMEDVGASDQQAALDKYNFELVGVIVHTGTTDSGHYYAFIKQSESDVVESSESGQRSWIEFQRRGGATVSRGANPLRMLWRRHDGARAEQRTQRRHVLQCVEHEQRVHARISPNKTNARPSPNIRPSGSQLPLLSSHLAQQHCSPAISACICIQPSPECDRHRVEHSDYQPQHTPSIT